MSNDNNQNPQDNKNVNEKLNKYGLEEPLKNIAVLIDADNVTAFVANELFYTTKTYGTDVIRRAYADWRSEYLPGWDWVCLHNGIEAIQQFAYTKRKNSSDMRLVIDAMELSFNGKVDGFVIASSDSDFTPLIMNLRGRGFPVFGFGRSITHHAFKAACDNFVSYDHLATFKKRLESPQRFAPHEELRQIELKEWNEINEKNKQFQQQKQKNAADNDDFADNSEKESIDSTELENGQTEVAAIEAPEKFDDDARKQPPKMPAPNNNSPTNKTNKKAPTKTYSWLGWLQQSFGQAKTPVILTSNPIPPEYQNIELSEEHKQALEKIKPLLHQAIKNVADAAKWAPENKIIPEIEKLIPGFDPKDYGCRNLTAALLVGLGDICLGYREQRYSERWLEKESFPVEWQRFFKIIPIETLVKIMNSCIDKCKDEAGWAKVADLPNFYNLVPLNYGFQDQWELLYWLGYEVKIDYQDGDKTRALILPDESSPTANAEPRAEAKSEPVEPTATTVAENAESKPAVEKPAKSVTTPESKPAALKPFEKAEPVAEKTAENTLKPFEKAEPATKPVEKTPPQTTEKKPAFVVETIPAEEETAAKSEPVAAPVAQPKKEVEKAAPAAPKTTEKTKPAGLKPFEKAEPAAKPAEKSSPVAEKTPLPTTAKKPAFVIETIPAEEEAAATSEPVAAPATKPKKEAEKTPPAAEKTPSQTESKKPAFVIETIPAEEEAAATSEPVAVTADLDPDSFSTPKTQPAELKPFKKAEPAAEKPAEMKPAASETVKQSAPVAEKTPLQTEIKKPAFVIETILTEEGATEKSEPVTAAEIDGDLFPEPKAAVKTFEEKLAELSQGKSAEAAESEPEKPVAEKPVETKPAASKIESVAEKTSPQTEDAAEKSAPADDLNDFIEPELIRELEKIQEKAAQSDAENSTAPDDDCLAAIEAASEKLASLSKEAAEILEQLSINGHASCEELMAASARLTQMAKEADSLQDKLSVEDASFAAELLAMSEELATLAQEMAENPDLIESETFLEMPQESSVPMTPTTIEESFDLYAGSSAAKKHLPKTDMIITPVQLEKEIFAWREFYPEEELDTIGPMFPTYYEAFCKKQYDVERLEQIKPLIYKAIHDHCDQDGWATVSDIEASLKTHIADFDPSHYECSNMFYALSMVENLCPGYERDLETDEMVPSEGVIYFRIVPREKFIVAINQYIMQCNNNAWIETSEVARGVDINPLQYGFQSFDELLSWLGFEIKKDLQGKNRTRRRDLEEMAASTPERLPEDDFLDMPASSEPILMDLNFHMEEDDSSDINFVMVEKTIQDGLEIMPMSHFYPPNSFLHQKFFITAQEDCLPIPNYDPEKINTFLKIKPLVYNIISMASNQEGWALLDDIHNALKQNIADFRPDTYGFPNIMSMLKVLGDICLGYDKTQFHNLRREFGYTPYNKLKHYYMIIPYQQLFMLLKEGIYKYQDRNGWANIAQLEQFVKNHFDYHYYGFYYFSDLLRSVIPLEVENNSVRFKPI